MKKLFVGIFTGVVLATSVSAIASSGAIKTINASYSVNKLIVNGVDTGKGSTAFISNGTTYVPLRTVSDALGADIKWDPSTKNITINSRGGATLEEPTDLPIANQPANKVPAPAPAPAQGQKFIGAEKAKQIAVNKFGGKVIAFEPDLYDDDFDHIPSYEIKVRNGYKVYEVDVNAITGEIISFDLDD